MSIISDINIKHERNAKEKIKFSTYCLWRVISPLHFIFFSKELHHCDPLSFAEKRLPHFLVKHIGSKIIMLSVQALLKNMFFSVKRSLTLLRGANFYFKKKLWQPFVPESLLVQTKKFPL